MQQTDLILVFIERLEAAGLRYMIGGSVASMVYGEPRLTNDVDIVLDVTSSDAARLPVYFPESEFYCPPVEVLIVEARRAQRGHCNIIHHESGHRADIYFCGDDPLQSWGLENRRSIELTPQVTVSVAPPEYVILRKLEYYREGGSKKHISDIRGMLDVSGELIDLQLVGRRAAALGLSSEWEAVRGA